MSKRSIEKKVPEILSMIDSDLIHMKLCNLYHGLSNISKMLNDVIACVSYPASNIEFDMSSYIVKNVAKHAVDYARTKKSYTKK